MPLPRRGQVRSRAVGVWLLVMAGLVVVQVSLGGVTRLTDSGLSITEWKPLLGVVPPTSEPAWQVAFEKYQQIPQFQRLKSSLTLDEFKFIYFWEWFHRLWGRLLGVAFVVPLIVFWRRGQLQGLRARLLVLLGLGGLQGLLGWVMVASGLQDLVYVSHLRLAAHFMLAMLVLSALLWVGLEQVSGPKPAPAPRLRAATAALLGAVTLQLTIGALTAGLKAALFAPTWPTINGAWIPTFAGAWFNEPLGVQFVHRSLAYAVALGVLAWWWAARRTLRGPRHAVLTLVLLQVVLGVVVVLRAPFRGELILFGVLHQLVGVSVLLAVVWALFQLAPARAEGVEGLPARAEPIDGADPEAPLAGVGRSRPSR